MYIKGNRGYMYLQLLRVHIFTFEGVYRGCIKNMLCSCYSGMESIESIEGIEGIEGHCL